MGGMREAPPDIHVNQIKNRIRSGSFLREGKPFLFAKMASTTMHVHNITRQIEGLQNKLKSTRVGMSQPIVPNSRRNITDHGK